MTNASESKKQELLKQKYMEYQILEKQMKQVSSQLEQFDMQIVELNNIKSALTELKQVTIGSEILVPISPGIFLKAKLEDNDELIVNVGDNVSVSKTNKQAIELIDQQIAEMKSHRDNYNSNVEQIVMLLKNTEQQLINLTKETGDATDV